MITAYTVSAAAAVALILFIIFSLKKKSIKVRKRAVDLLFFAYAAFVFSGCFFIDRMTSLNGLGFTEIGKAGTVWMFVLLFFYFSLLLVYFGATSKIQSRGLKKLTVLAGLPVSLIMYAVLPWYLQASAGAGLSFSSPRAVLKFAEVTLSVVYPVAAAVLLRPFEGRPGAKDLALFRYFLPFGALMFPFGMISALMGNGSENLRAGSLYQLAWIVATVLLFVLLYIVLSRKDARVRYGAVLLLSLSLMIQFFKYYTYSEIELWNLPIHICNMGTIFIFASLFFRWRLLEMFTYYINVFGATMAMAVPQINDGFWQFSTFHFMFQHTMLIIIPILSVLLGVTARPKRSEILKVLPLFFGYYLFSVITGAIFVVYDPNVNYFYVIKDTVAQFLPFLMPLRDITFTIGRAVFYPVYWLVIFVGIVGIVYILDFIYNYIYVFEDRRIEMRAIIAQEKALRNAALTAPENNLPTAEQKAELSFADAVAISEIRSAEIGGAQTENGTADEDVPSRPALLEVKNLQKTYSSTGVTVIRDIGLRVEAGEIVWLIGANGAGKSTFIKCITGIIRPDDGAEVYIGGKSLFASPEYCKSLIGYMPDNHMQYEQLTGKEYIEYVAGLYGYASKNILEELFIRAEELDLVRVLDRKIKTYSHGMKQKTALLAAIIHHPEILVLDEPLSGLDFDSAEVMKKFIVDYAKEGNCVLYSSHLYDVLDPICTKILLLHGGTIVEDIPVADRVRLRSLQEELLKKDVWGNSHA